VPSELLYLSQVLFYSVYRWALCRSGLLKSTVVSVMTDLSKYKIFLADFSTGCGLHPQYFCQEAYNLWQSVGELYLPVGCVSRHTRIQIVMSTQLLRLHLFHPLYYSASVDDVHS